jgi:hypothetical protein
MNEKTQFKHLSFNTDISAMLIIEYNPLFQLVAPKSSHIAFKAVVVKRLVAVVHLFRQT